MSDIPFGFNRPSEPGDENDPGKQDPFGAGNMQDFAAMLHQFADMLSNQSPGGGPLNWNLAKDIARHQVAEKGDPSVLDAQRRAVVEALRLADLWLNEVTTHPSRHPHPAGVEPVRVDRAHPAGVVDDLRPDGRPHGRVDGLGDA